MTDEEIDRLEAGPVLDALVAELVIGEKMPALPHEHGDVLATIRSSKQAWLCSPDFDEGDVCKWEPYHFSGYINLAWSIVEIIHKRIDCAVLVQRNMLGIDVPGSLVAVYSVRLHHSNNDSWVISAHGDTAALAICKAALKAVTHAV